MVGRISFDVKMKSVLMLELTQAASLSTVNEFFLHEYSHRVYALALHEVLTVSSSLFYTFLTDRQLFTARQRFICKHHQPNLTL